MSTTSQRGCQISRIPDRDSIRRELAETRAQFHALLASLADGDLQGPTATKWNVGELLMHLITSYERTPAEIAHARAGMGMWNLPLPLLDRLNYVATRWQARRITSEALRARYDWAYTAMLAMLDTVEDDEWQRGARFFSERHYTVEDLFHLHPRHFAEHARHMSRHLRI